MQVLSVYIRGFLIISGLIIGAFIDTSLAENQILAVAGMPEDQMPLPPKDYPPKPEPEPEPETTEECPTLYGKKMEQLCITFDHRAHTQLSVGDITRFYDSDNKHLGLTLGHYAEQSGELCACIRPRNDGCFPPGVALQMADGSEKVVEDISVGDYIANPVTGKSYAVEKVIESFEKNPIIEFGFEGTTVRVSQTHPVLTDSGVKQAKALNLRDQVIDAEGNLRNITTIRKLPIEEGQRVINFILETDSSLPSDHLLLSDGIVTGDLTLQLMISDKQ